VVLQEAMRLKSELASLVSEHKCCQAAEMSKLKSNIKEVDTNLQIIMHEQLAKQAVLESRMQRLEEMGSTARKQENCALQEAIKLKGDLQELMDERQKEERSALNDVMALKGELDGTFKQRLEGEVALQDVIKLKRELEVIMDRKQKDEINVCNEVVALKRELHGFLNQRLEEKNLLSDMTELKANLEVLLKGNHSVTRASKVQQFQVGNSCAIDAVAVGTGEFAPTVVAPASLDSAIGGVAPSAGCVDTDRSLHSSNLPETRCVNSNAMGITYAAFPKGMSRASTRSLNGKEGRCSSLNSPLLKVCEVTERSRPEVSERCKSLGAPESCRTLVGSEQPPLRVAKVLSAGAPSNVPRAQVLTMSNLPSATSQRPSSQKQPALGALPRAATIPIQSNCSSAPVPGPVPPRVLSSGARFHAPLQTSFSERQLQ